MIDKITTKHFFELNHSPVTIEVIRSLPKPDKIHLNGKSLPVFDDFNDIAFGQKCMLDQIVYDNDYQLIKKLLSILYYSSIFDCKFDSKEINKCDEFIDKSLIVESYPVTLHYLELLNKTNEIEREQLNETRDTKQIQAGIEKLSAFGVVGVVHQLAGGNLLDHEKIYELPYVFVFTILRYQKEEREFNKRYSELLSQKK